MWFSLKKLIKTSHSNTHFYAVNNIWKANRFSQTWAYVRQYGVQAAVVILGAPRLVVAVRLLTLHHEGARHLWAERGNNPAEEGGSWPGRCCAWSALAGRCGSKSFKRVQPDIGACARPPSRLPGVARTGVSAAAAQLAALQKISVCCVLVSTYVVTGNRKTVCSGGDFLSLLNADLHMTECFAFVSRNAR